MLCHHTSFGTLKCINSKGKTSTGKLCHSMFIETGYQLTRKNIVQTANNRLAVNFDGQSALFMCCGFLCGFTKLDLIVPEFKLTNIFTSVYTSLTLWWFRVAWASLVLSELFFVLKRWIKIIYTCVYKFYLYKIYIYIII